ncbi:MAG: hypothetical protein EKK64_04820 [Neisseriaceae bacterium]|nr:MAG: hypothetical protein EKK64_04820 [Neisseriaceae bacterium]
MFDFLYNIVNGFKKVKNAKQLKEIVQNKYCEVQVKLEGIWLKDMPEEVKAQILKTSDEKLEQVLLLCPHRYKKN